MTKVLQRHYIPVGGLATREPLKGDEGNLRLSLGFHPNWYHERVGVDFSERWHQESYYRFDSIIKMKKYLQERFPRINNFQVQLRNGVDPRCATISSLHGTMMIPSFYGVETLYAKDSFPDMRSGSEVSKKLLGELEPFDLLRIPIIRQLMDQMTIIEKEWGVIDGYINTQGILNTAFRVRGQEIFTDMVEDPDFVHRFFQHIAQTTINFQRMVQKRQRNSGFYANIITNSNCVVNMISPSFYQQFVLPYDVQVSKAFNSFGIHTCNWDASPYFKPIREIENLGYIDMGIDSNLILAREIFPDVRRAVMLSPEIFSENSTGKIENIINKIFYQLAPCDIALGSIDKNVDDKKVQSLISHVKDLQK